MKSFTDCDNKKGSVGTTVIKFFYGKEVGEQKTVRIIQSKGAGGTWIYFTDRDSGNAKEYKIITQ